MGPLKDIRVIEMAGLGAGPLCGMMLADMGAEVLLIDKPGRPSPEALIHVDKIDPLNRSKRRVCLNLKTASHVTLLKEIIGLSDVLIESYRPGVMERLGLGPDACLTSNPRLVYARLTGWGQTGPMSDKAGHDPNYVAATGALYHAGSMGAPPVTPPTLLGDASAAALLVAGISAALVSAEKTGHGQVLDAAIAECTNYLTTYAKSFYQAGQLTDERGGAWLDGAAPWNATYVTSDGGYMVVAAIESKFYEALLSALDLDENPLFVNAGQWDQEAWPEQRAMLAARFAANSRAHWSDVFLNADACVSPALTYGESHLHPQFAHREAHWVEEGQVFPAPAPRFSLTPFLATEKPENNDIKQYFTEIGISEALISAWQSEP